MKKQKCLTFAFPPMEIVYDHSKMAFQDVISSLKKVQKVYAYIKNYTVNRKTEFEILSAMNGMTEKEYTEKEYSKSIESVIYDEIIHNSGMNICLSNSINAAIQSAIKNYDNYKCDVNKAKRTRETYKAPQPIPISGENLKIREENGYYYLQYQPFSMNHNYKLYMKKRVPIIFKIKMAKKYDWIMKRCLSAEFPDFKLGEAKITRAKKGRERWYIHLTYSCTVTQVQHEENKLDKNLYLGVDLGVVNALYASVYGDKEKNALPISGEHMVGYVHKMKKRLSEMQRSVAYCGEGKIGHGKAKRFEAVTKLQGKIANYRDTENKKMARQVVDYAIKNGCGTIQMENLSGIKSNKKGKFLGDWVYYNLQLAIEHAARKVGIDVVYVKPRYTSQRCSKCGAIHKENRKSQSEFVCIECGFTANADFNASQNLAIPFIDEIIEEVKPSKKYKKVG